MEPKLPETFSWYDYLPSIPFTSSWYGTSLPIKVTKNVQIPNKPQYVMQSTELQTAKNSLKKTQRIPRIDQFPPSSPVLNELLQNPPTLKRVSIEK